MAKNRALQEAARARQDEFYTDLRDIEHELMYYMPLFKGKTVLCNCDDPYESAFFEYFATSFNMLGLRKLIATCYAGSPIAQQQLSLFE
ncbi:MAG: modification methylase, partial [Synergistaceae bacterium]|nr:modification methylase [Synergistaceae bacterium]